MDLGRDDSDRTFSRPSLQLMSPPTGAPAGQRTSPLAPAGRSAYGQPPWSLRVQRELQRRDYCVRPRAMARSRPIPPCLRSRERGRVRLRTDSSSSTSSARSNRRGETSAHRRRHAAPHITDLAQSSRSMPPAGEDRRRVRAPPVAIHGEATTTSPLAAPPSVTSPRNSASPRR